MIVVADSSVLISLSTIGQLEIIRTRFPDGICLAPAVWREVVEQGRERPGAEEVRTATWVKRLEIKDQLFAQYLQVGLDSGEAESIVLAREKSANLILLDERDARGVAMSLGVQVLGTIGLLIWAKRTGHVENLRELLDKLQDTANFRVSKSLYVFALHQVGE
ncbi:MAG: DUF3368 domain-containing protein [Desulfovermiculus sp.]|nr:DUF3368 domain-containing protein [Desulfovermiculus sp.]